MIQFLISLTPLYLAYDRGFGVIELYIMLLFKAHTPPLLPLPSLPSSFLWVWYLVHAQWVSGPGAKDDLLGFVIAVFLWVCVLLLWLMGKIWMRRKIPRWGYRWHGIDTWNSQCESEALITWLMQGDEIVTGTFCYGCFLQREPMKRSLSTGCQYALQK